MSTKCPKNAEKMSEKCPKIVRGGADNTTFGHFLTIFAYLVDAFVWRPCPMLARGLPIEKKGHLIGDHLGVSLGGSQTSPDLLKPPWTSRNVPPPPQVPRRPPGTSLWIFRAIQRFPGSSPDFLDERQITHLICARLKYDLYDFFKGVLWAFHIRETTGRRPKTHPGKVI